MQINESFYEQNRQKTCKCHIFFVTLQARELCTQAEERKLRTNKH